MSHTTQVTVPCPIKDTDGVPCEEDVHCIVCSTPGEGETRDYPGTGDSHDVVDYSLCLVHQRPYTDEEMVGITSRAIHQVEVTHGR